MEPESGVYDVTAELVVVAVDRAALFREDASSKEGECNNGNTCVKGPCMLESLRMTELQKCLYGALSG